MASPQTQTHPRRRPHKASGSPSPSLTTQGLSLPKSPTFHSPTSVSSDLCDIDNARYMPKRSPTCKEDLEDMLDESAGIARITQLLNNVDKTLSGKCSAAAADILKDPEVLPLPHFMIGRAALDRDAMDVDKPQSAEDQLDKDSGIGSSIASNSRKDRTDPHSSTRHSVKSAVTTTSTAVTGSFSALGAQSATTRALSKWAEEQIQKRIVQPILAEESLKEFHPLIEDVPKRIGAKFITNLRDLEKTLLFLAPEFSSTPKSYLDFCETWINCVHSTVDFLPEPDQRLPSDRPYTNHYFLDLVEQIRRMAAIMAATREKEARGEELDEMDYTPGEKITLRGGLSHNGKPVELVREKEDGKVIPIAEGSTDATSPGTKRSLEVDMDDDIHRSMARRRKSDKPGDVLHVCRDCRKEFKRPCDLTKHEKTHTRPWKCPEHKCKYHDMGWPTEKERDRHVNDKHSVNPPQYKCLWSNCTYVSKRESNCKQHMEKAHGYNYVRSKSNGRKKNGSTSSPNNRTPQTPATPLIATPASALPTIHTPITPSEASPFVESYHDFDTFNYPFTPDISTDDLVSRCRRESDATSGTAMTSSSSHSPNQPTLFEEAITPEDTDFQHTMNNLNLNIHYNFNGNTFQQQQQQQQQPTPAFSPARTFAGLETFNFGQPSTTNFQNSGANSASSSGSIHHLSPGAQVDVTLFSPPMGNMHYDEGFGEGYMGHGQDFTLFPPTSNIASASTGAEMFPELSTFTNPNDNFSYPTNMDEDFNDFNFPSHL